jgi:hypothetical protein
VRAGFDTDSHFWAIEAIAMGIANINFGCAFPQMDIETPEMHGNQWRVF